MAGLCDKAPKAFLDTNGSQNGTIPGFWVTVFLAGLDAGPLFIEGLLYFGHELATEAQPRFEIVALQLGLVQTRRETGRAKPPNGTHDFEGRNRFDTQAARDFFRVFFGPRCLGFCCGWCAAGNEGISPINHPWWFPLRESPGAPRVCFPRSMQIEKPLFP